MNSRSTWTWLIVAVALLAFILVERQFRKPPPGPLMILPQLNAAEVTSVQVRPAGQLEIRADRTNEDWALTAPISYPAQKVAIEGLLQQLKTLSPARYITPREQREAKLPDSEFGFDSPQFSLNLQQGDSRTQILIGDLTPPGDQLYLRVVGVEGVCVVDADLLKVIPHSVDQWRDTAFLDLRGKPFDHLTVSRAGRAVELQYDSSNGVWRITRPLAARADHERITSLLQQLQTLRVLRFIPEDAKTDLESMGLQPPEMELAFAQGTNSLAILQIGKPTTNESAEVFARRVKLGTIVTVSRDIVAPWETALKEENGFRDKHLVSSRGTVQRIEVKGTNSFVLQRTNNHWNVAGETFPVDAVSADEFVGILREMQVVQFKDAVTGPELESYGFSSPTEEIILQQSRPAGSTDTSIATVHLIFGTNQDDKVFVKRADEDSVYAMKLGDVQQLPKVGWELRERRIWNFSEENVARLTIRQGERTRELIRNGTNSWTFAPGSQGDINPFGVEEAVHRMGELAAAAWVARGDDKREQFGLATNRLALTFQLKNGDKRAVEFGAVSESLYPYAATVLDGETWIFQFPIVPYQYVSSYLTIPAGVP